MNTVAPIKPVERPTGRLAIRRNAPGAASGRGPPSKSMTGEVGVSSRRMRAGSLRRRGGKDPEPNWPASASG